VLLNGPLDRDSLVVDRTRFRWVEVSDRLLALQPFVDLGPGERLIIKVGFKDRALPAQAVLAVVTDPLVVDGTVEIDRRANTPEALLAALAQKEAELEELKARSVGSGPASLVLSEWLDKKAEPIEIFTSGAPASMGGLEVLDSFGYAGKFSALVAIKLRNPQGQKPWVLGKVHFTSTTGPPVKVLSVQMKLEQLQPGEEGLVVVETRPPSLAGRTFSMELVDASGQRRLSINLKAK
jgi:uncharacterized protein (TIGR02268 family)